MSALHLCVLPPAIAADWSAGAASTRTQEELIEAQRIRALAILRGDRARLERMLDDGFLVTNASGQTRNKAQFVSDLVADTKSVAFTDLTIHAAGDTAIVVGTRATQLVNGTPEILERFTTTYIKRKGEWHAIAEHVGRLQAK